MLCELDGVGGRISSLVFLADGKHVVCICKAEKLIQVWNVGDRGGREPLTKSGVAVNVIASTKDGNSITV